jgi:hypothetical protein
MAGSIRYPRDMLGEDLHSAYEIGRDSVLAVISFVNAIVEK